MKNEADLPSGGASRGAGASERSVCAVVVTYNRLDMLKECLTALLAQERPLDQIVVVDNASTDDTRETVLREFPEVALLALGENVGGAGGFHEGMKWARDQGFDWFWVMDDDTIPTPSALAELLAAAQPAEGAPAPAMLASKVLWTNGRLHPMNKPGLKGIDMDGLVEGAERGLLSLRHSTFVSLLVSRDAVVRYGLPHKHYFIWSDDIEFTARVLRHEPGYLVPTSVVHHKTKTAHTPMDAGERFYFAVRNGIYVLKSEALESREKVLFGAVIADQIRGFLVRNRFRPAMVRVVLRGIRDGVLGRGTGGSPRRVASTKAELLAPGRGRDALATHSSAPTPLVDVT